MARVCLVPGSFKDLVGQRATDQIPRFEGPKGLSKKMGIGVTECPPVDLQGGQGRSRRLESLFPDLAQLCTSLLVAVRTKYSIKEVRQIYKDRVNGLCAEAKYAQKRCSQGLAVV